MTPANILGNQLLRQTSGQVDIPDDRLTSFLYELMRDHVPPGIVMELVNSSTGETIQYTNGYLAKMAQHFADRLRNNRPGT